MSIVILVKMSIDFYGILHILNIRKNVAGLTRGCFTSMLVMWQSHRGFFLFLYTHENDVIHQYLVS